ncbi:MAG TPA: MarR family transcriptional regulator [Caulobacteraceae bacterium]
MAKAGNAPGPAERQAGPVTDLDRSVLFLTTAFANKLSKGASRRLKKALGIGLMEWRVVCNLGAEPGRSAVRIAEVSGVDKSVVSRAVAELERQGLITAQVEPPGRQTALRLTPTGQALHDRGVRRADEREQRLLEGFNPEEQDRLVDFLKRLTANLERLEDAPRGGG